MKNIWKTDTYTLKRAFHKKLFYLLFVLPIKTLKNYHQSQDTLAKLKKNPSTTLTAQNGPKLKIRFMNFPVVLILGVGGHQKIAKKCRRLIWMFPNFKRNFMACHFVLPSTHIILRLINANQYLVNGVVVHPIFEMIKEGLIFMYLDLHLTS